MNLASSSIVKNVFGHSDFRKDQKPIVQAMESGKDTFAIMTTGGGKSLCYQSVAMDRYSKGMGMTVVVSPLISLMEDQVNKLNSIGVTAKKFDSTIPKNEKQNILQNIISGKLNMLYISPEQFENEDLMESLKASKIAFATIDEAHCVSLWGQTFRRSYLKINQYLSEIESVQGKSIQRCAFTATAKSDIIQDVCDGIGMRNPTVLKGDPNRQNIAFNIRKTDNKIKDLTYFLNKVKGEPTIVYAATIKAVDEITRRINEMGIQALPYYGPLETKTKTKNQKSFLGNECTVLVATNAFGMGVDKPDVRNVIHFHMPDCIENYYQEAGRGGRDGKAARALMLYSASDRKIRDYFMHWSHPTPNIIEDVRRTVLSLLTNDIQGITAETIANACQGEVDSRHVTSALDTMVEFDIITNTTKTDDPHLMLELTDTYANEIDYDLLAKRKSAQSQKLHLMERYIKDDDCKRKYLMEYFEREKKTDDCGNCSNCSLKFSRDKKNGIAFDEIKLADTINALKLTKSRPALAMNILLGESTPRISRMNLDKTSEFGKYQKNEAESLQDIIKYLITNQIVYEKNGKAIINEELLNKVRSNTDSKPKISIAIKELRKEIADELNVPEFMVFNDAIAKKLANSNYIEQDLKIHTTGKVYDLAMDILNKEMTNTA